MFVYKLRAFDILAENSFNNNLSSINNLYKSNNRQYLPTIKVKNQSTIIMEKEIKEQFKQKIAN